MLSLFFVFWRFLEKKIEFRIMYSLKVLTIRPKYIGGQSIPIVTIGERL